MNGLRQGPGASATPAQQFAANRARVTEIITTAQAALTLAKTSPLLTGIPSSLPSISDFSNAALEKVKRHFHVDKTAKPLLQITRIEQVFLDMQRAIGHIPQGVVLFVDEPRHLELDLSCSLPEEVSVIICGTMFSNGTNLPVDSIYLCPKIAYPHW